MEHIVNGWDKLTDKPILNAITKQLRETITDSGLVDNQVKIYTDRQDQEFKIPGFYVYLANVLTTKGLRNREFMHKRKEYSYFIMYKNGENMLFQDNALQVLSLIDRGFQYLHLNEYTIQINEIEAEFNDLAMVITLRFVVPTRILYNLPVVQSLELEEEIKYASRNMGNTKQD